MSALPALDNRDPLEGAITSWRQIGAQRDAARWRGTGCRRDHGRLTRLGVVQ